jgi:hypothetical protein
MDDLSSLFAQWKSTFFAFSLIIEGTTEKVMPLKLIYNRNFGFIEQKKCIFEHYREFQARKTLLIDIIFATKKYLLTFLELPPICFC